MERKRAASELREQIANLDREIVERLDARARISREIHALLEGEQSVDADELKWLDKLVASGAGDMSAESLRAIFQQIRAESRSIEQPVRVAYLGPPGSFCAQTAQDYFGHPANFVECVSVEEVLDEVVRRRVAFAVFPFESSVDGLVQPSVTALAQTDLVLVAERTIAAQYHLMSKSKELSELEKVFLTPLARTTCQRFLDKELPRASIIDVRSPIEAAQLAKEDVAAACVVPERCGGQFDLEILCENVGEIADLKLRFGVAGVRPAMRSGHDVTCLLFSVDDSPGALFDVLRHFSERGINLRKLHSRPVQGEAWDYVFYMEISGHVTERPVVTALEAVKRSTKYLKVLGSFPVLA